jgi:hypothetical protein
MPETFDATSPVYAKVDWDGDGDFLDDYEDVSADVMPGMSSERGRELGRVYGSPKIPTGSFTLTNESKRYTSPYSGGPLYGELRPGRRCVLGRQLGNDLTDMDSAVVLMDSDDVLMGGTDVIPILSGRTDAPVETYGYGRRNVQVAAYGLTQRLMDTKISILYQAALTTGHAFAQIVEQVGLGADEFILDLDAYDNGRMLLHWFVDNESAWDAMVQIWATEGPPAALYEDIYGRIVFEGRNYRTLTDRAQTVQYTFNDMDTDGYWFTDLQYSASYQSVINDMAVNVEQQIVGAGAVKVYEYGSIVNLGAGSVQTHVIRTEGVINGLQTPQLTTDYLITSGSLASVVATLTGPREATIVWTASGSGAQVSPIVGNDNGYQVRALPILTIATITANGTLDTSASQAEYGVKKPPTEISGNIWPAISEADADGLIDGYLLSYQEPRALVTMRAVGATGPLLAALLDLEVSDRIHINDTWSGTDLDLWVEQISHQVDSLASHTVEIIGERIVEPDWGLWDEALWDQDVWGQ